MPHQRKILILTAKTGGGHISLAEALRDRLQQDYAISIEDLLPELFSRHYSFVAQKAPWLWSCEYHLSDSPGIARLGHQVMIPLIAPGLTQLLHRVQPDLVLSVHPLLTRAVKHVLDRHTPKIPFAMLFSDPMRVHYAWLTEHNAAAAFAPTQEIYAQALAEGFDPSRLHFVGWPIRSQFSTVAKLPREQLIADLNRSQQWDLDPRCLTVFVSSGAEGATHVEEVARLILSLSQNVQVIVAAGTNWALYQRCQGVKNLYVFSFTHEVATFMAVAHLMIGRCSPNILFEALALGKPLLVTSFMPGQEEDNLRFIERHGLGWSALETGQLRQLVTTIVTEFPSARSPLHALEARVQEYQRMNTTANEEIVPRIHALLDGTPLSQSWMNLDNLQVN